MPSKSSQILRGLVHSTLLAGAPALALADPSVQYPTYTVGPQPDGSYVMSTGQVITPAGTVINLGSPVRAKAVALNPTHHNSAAVLEMGASQAVEVFDRASGALLQSYSPFGDSTGSFTGIRYTPDGKHLLFSQDDSYLAIAAVDPKTGLLSDYDRVFVAPSQAFINCDRITVGLPSDPVTDACGNFYNGNNYSSNPAGVAVSDDSKTAYVVLNANNTLQPVDLKVSPPQLKGTQVRVGNAPNSVVLEGKFAYVSNEGGRIATPQDFTNISNGTPIVASRESGTATTGTISVVDTKTDTLVATIDSGGRHPTGMAISGDLLFVTNTGSDNIGVIDLRSNQLMNTISLKLPVRGEPFGAEPGALPGYPDADLLRVGLHKQLPGVRPGGERVAHAPAAAAHHVAGAAALAAV